MVPTRLVLAIAVLALAAPPTPALAQLGSSPNVPGRTLFQTDRPARLNNGLGDMAAQPDRRPPRPRPARRQAHR